MSELSRLADIAEIIGAMLVVGGLVFAILQMRQLRQQRRELAAIELFRSFGNPKFADAYLAVLNLPDGLRLEDIRRDHPEIERSAMLIATTMENIGVMTFQRIVPFLVVNDLVGSSTVVLWRKLEGWAEDFRIRTGQPKAFEWFHWLADKLGEGAVGEQVPAFKAFADWKPTRLTDERYGDVE